MPKLKYHRILLKLSGEALGDTEGRGIDVKKVENIVTEVAAVRKLGVQIAIVLGGGNFWRFRDFQKIAIPRVASDQIGMVATAMNALALSNALNNKKIPAHPYCAFSVESILPGYQIFSARSSLSTNHVVLLAGGTGHPYFTTDTAAALRAIELECDVLIKATKVDGVYDSDPKKNKKAKKFGELSFDAAINQGLEIMDQTAFALCRENTLPIIVYNGFVSGNLKKIVTGERLGTLVQ